MVSRLKHENFVELLGYCVDGSSRVLAYEFASNGSLHDILHGKQEACLIVVLISLLHFWIVQLLLPIIVAT